jgi:asparagine synthase (glutamine-hydrolysing)
MCGFAGFLATPASGVRATPAAVDPMIDSMAHRGPDQEGTWASPEDGIALGFRRLAIVDLSEAGHQPMRSATGRFVITFNGEIYNFAEMRKELERKGFRFRGHSDTEVILASFEERGIEESLRRFNGMFAFAVWDTRDRVLVLARDRLGIKPLYVFRKPGFISFGSELKALAAGPVFDSSIDQAALGSYLRYLYVPAPETIYEHATKLLPGTFVTITSARDPVPEPRTYWSLQRAYEDGESHRLQSDGEVVERLEELLVSSVRMRMVADVPLGALLSGGVDSSAIVSIMQEISDRKVKTFTIGFGDDEHDESEKARAISHHLGTDHEELRLTGPEVLEVIPRLVDMFDEPHADPSQIPTYLVSRMTRKHVTVALSGDGGDELFAGYNRYRFGERMITRLEKVPRLPRRLASGVLGSVSPSTWGRAYRGVAAVLPGMDAHRLPEQKIRKVTDMLGVRSEAEMYRSLMSVWQQPERLLKSPCSATDRAMAIIDGGGPRSLLDRMMLADQTTYLPDDLLTKVDRASMAVSLEVRVPLLDHRIVEMAWRTPAEAKIRNGVTKWALREVLYKRVPRELIDRPKTGFSVPIDEWLRGPLKGWADDLLSPASIRGSGVLEPGPIAEAWRAVQQGKGSGGAVWTILMFRAWQDRWC